MAYAGTQISVEAFSFPPWNSRFVYAYTGYKTHPQTERQLDKS